MRKSEILKMRVSLNEKNLIETIAKSQGKTTSQYMRESSLGSSNLSKEPKIVQVVKLKRVHNNAKLESPSINMNLVMSEVLEVKDKLIIKVLTQAFNREPTLEDFQRCELIEKYPSIIPTSVLKIDGVDVGAIEIHFGTKVEILFKPNQYL